MTTEGGLHGAVDPNAFGRTCARTQRAAQTAIRVGRSVMVRIIDFCFLVLKAAIAALLAAMVVLVFGNVVLRYAFNSGLTMSEEVSRWLFVWLT
ncbi:TRAP transporter small permease subunit, partial [Acinetobacter baumannii]